MERVLIVAVQPSAATLLLSWLDALFSDTEVIPVDADYLKRVSVLKAVEFADTDKQAAADATVSVNKLYFVAQPDRDLAALINRFNAEPKVDFKCLLFYANPTAAIINLPITEPLSKEVVHKAFNQWMSSAESLLNFYRSQPKSSLLLHIDDCSENIATLVEAINNYCQLSVTLDCFTKTEKSHSALLRYIGNHLLQECPEIYSFYDELNLTAKLFGGYEGVGVVDFSRETYDDLRKVFFSTEMKQQALLDSMEALEQENTTIAKLNSSLTVDVELATRQLGQVQAELEHAHSVMGEIEARSTAGAKLLDEQSQELSRLRILAEQVDAKNKQCQDLENKHHEKIAELELSTLQIAQLQEEIELVWLQSRQSLSDLEKIRQDNEKLEAEKGNILAERNLAILQINQLQEELEFYFAAANKAALASSTSGLVNTSQVEAENDSLQLLSVLRSRFPSAAASLYE